MIQRSRFNFFSEAQLWYQRAGDTLPLSTDFENTIVLSDEFDEEVTAHPNPTDLEALKVLSASPVVLDLFMWLSYRCLFAKKEEAIPILGEFDLAAQLGSVDYSRPRTIPGDARPMARIRSRYLAGISGSDQSRRAPAHHLRTHCLLPVVRNEFRPRPRTRVVFNRVPSSDGRASRYKQALSAGSNYAATLRPRSGGMANFLSVRLADYAGQG